jgi:hypothetical protein
LHHYASLLHPLRFFAFVLFRPVCVWCVCACVCVCVVCVWCVCVVCVCVCVVCVCVCVVCVCVCGVCVCVCSCICCSVAPQASGVVQPFPAPLVSPCLSWSY